MVKFFYTIHTQTQNFCSYYGNPDYKSFIMALYVDHLTFSGWSWNPASGRVIRTCLDSCKVGLTLYFFRCWSGSDQADFQCFRFEPVFVWVLTPIDRIQVDRIFQKNFQGIVSGEKST